MKSYLFEISRKFINPNIGFHNFQYILWYVLFYKMQIVIIIFNIWILSISYFVVQVLSFASIF